jgi:hypothetical protein
MRPFRIAAFVSMPCLAPHPSISIPKSMVGTQGRGIMECHIAKVETQCATIARRAWSLTYHVAMQHLGWHKRSTMKKAKP